MLKLCFSACTTKTDPTMKGTCYTASECSTKGGTSGGNCAAGNWFISKNKNI